MSKVIAVFDKPQGCIYCPFSVNIWSSPEWGHYKPNTAGYRCRLYPPDKRETFIRPYADRDFTWEKCPLIDTDSDAYAFQRKSDGAFLSGSDYRYHPPHMIKTDEYRPVRLFSKLDIDNERYKRRVNPKRFNLVKVKVIPVSVEDWDNFKI